MDLVLPVCHQSSHPQFISNTPIVRGFLAAMLPGGWDEQDQRHPKTRRRSTPGEKEGHSDQPIGPGPTGKTGKMWKGLELDPFYGRLGGSQPMVTDWASD